MAISATTPTPQAEGSAARPLDVVEWLRGRGVTVVAVMLILVQLWLKGSMLAGGYFRQDDFGILDRALASGFGWNYAMWMDVGHLFPIGMVIAWLQARMGLYDYPLAVGVVLLLLTACSFAMLRMLRTLFGNRPAILIPLGIFLFTPLSLVGDSSWEVAIELLPLEAAMFMAVDAHVRYLRSRRKRNVVAAAFWLAVGMLAADKGAVVPLLLLALTAGFFTARPRDVFKYWRAWLLYGAVLAAYLGIFFARLSTSTVRPGSPASVGHIVSLVATMMGTALLPSAVGGPWRWSTGSGFEYATPPAALQQLSWAVCLLVVIVTCAWRVRAWRAWAILAGWIAAADVAPVVLGRLGVFSGSLLGSEIRYLTDAAGVLALCVGLAVLPVTGERDPYRFQLGALQRPLSGVAAGVILAAALGSIWSLESLQSKSNATTAASRSYIATAQAAMTEASPGTVIVDTGVPQAIMDPGLFWNNALTSQVIGAMAGPSQHLTWVRTPQGVYTDPLMFDGQGQLRPLAIVGSYSWPPPRVRTGPNAGQSCWNVTTAGANIPLLGPVFRYAWTIRIAYTGPAGNLAVGFGGNWTRVSLPAGKHVAYVPALGSGSAVNLQLASGSGALCVTGVAVGSPQPDKTGPGIPAAPVTG